MALTYPEAAEPPRSSPILRWIGEGGLASRPQLTRRFWPHTEQRTSYRGLYRLVTAGYLLTARHRVLDRQHDLYVLTAAGSAALNTAPPAVRVGWPPPQEWAHLLLGQEVRLRLEDQLAAAGAGGHIRSWHTDYLLRHLAPSSQRKAEIADITVEWCRTATSAPETFHIEIDGAYFGTLLARKAAAYGAQPRRVLWVCLPARCARVRQAVAAYTNIEIWTLDHIH